MVKHLWNLSRNHILKFVLSTVVIKKIWYLKIFLFSLISFSAIIKMFIPSIQNCFQEYNLSLEDISIRAFKKDHLKISVLTEDLNLDYEEKILK